MSAPRLAPALPAIVAAALVAVTMAGCGSSTPAATTGTATTGRAAAGPDSWPASVTCPTGASAPVQLAVDNRLPVAISPAAGEINCAHWSGTATPAAVNGTTVAAGAVGTHALARRGATPTDWRLAIRVDGAVVGTVTMRAFTSHRSGRPRTSISLPAAELTPLGHDYLCGTARLGPITAAATSPSPVDDDIADGHVVIFSDGTHAMARACWLTP